MSPSDVIEIARQVAGDGNTAGTFGVKTAAATIALPDGRRTVCYVREWHGMFAIALGQGERRVQANAPKNMYPNYYTAFFAALYTLEAQLHTLNDQRLEKTA